MLYQNGLLVTLREDLDFHSLVANYPGLAEVAVRLSEGHRILAPWPVSTYLFHFLSNQIDAGVILLIVGDANL